MERYKEFFGNLISPIYKQFITTLVFCLTYFLSTAQKEKDSIPLHNYLQQHFDTTIILDAHSHDGVGPNYYIIGIKDDKISTFTYTWPSKADIFELELLPKDMAKKYISQLLSFRRTLPDTNTYFLPYSAYRFTRKIVDKFMGSPLVLNMVSDLLKRSIDSLQLWNIVGDEKEKRGCPENTRHPGIQPYDNYLIWLITQNDTKKLYFYEPGYFENLCPGRIGRQAAIRLIKLVNNTFRR